MPGAVLMKHHSDIRSTRSALAMGSSAGCPENQLSLLQLVLYPCVTPHSLMNSSIPAIKVLDRESTISTTVQIS
jgi:hypothetical protein